MPSWAASRRVNESFLLPVSNHTLYTTYNPQKRTLQETLEAWVTPNPLLSGLARRLRMPGARACCDGASDELGRTSCRVVNIEQYTDRDSQYSRIEQ